MLLTFSLPAGDTPLPAPMKAGDEVLLLLFEDPPPADKAGTLFGELDRLPGLLLAAVLPTLAIAGEAALAVICSGLLLMCVSVTPAGRFNIRSFAPLSLVEEAT